MVLVSFALDGCTHGSNLGPLTEGKTLSGNCSRCKILVCETTVPFIRLWMVQGYKKMCCN